MASHNRTTASEIGRKVIDIPGIPTIGTATAGAESISVTFTANSSGKGGAASSYIAKSNPGNITGTGSTSPVVITGLTAGTSYTATVAAVNSTGTSEYSSASNSATALAGSSYESIATVTVGSGGVSSVSFSSIPSTFEHLQIRYSTTANTGSNFFINYNSDTTTGNYKNHKITGYGYAIDADTGDNRLIGITQSSFPGVGVVDILDYKNTNKYKTTRFLSGSDGNGGTCRMQFGSVLYISTNAISALQIVCDGTIEQHSSFALYGIKGA